jgi:hypothetical protein
MNKNTSIINPRNIIIAILILFLGALYLSLSYNGVFFPPDEGAILYHFEKSAEGAVQHRDYYSVYGAAFYILGKWLFQLFGFSIIATRIFVVLLKLLMAALIYFIAVGVIRRSFAFLSAMGFIVWWADPFVATPIYLYPAHLSQLLGLLSVLFLLIYCRNGRKSFVLCAGLAAGFNCLFKPNAGAFNMMAIFFFLYAREMLMDLGEVPAEFSDKESGSATLGKAWIVLELGVSAIVAIMLSAVVGKFGIEAPVFFVFLFPIYIIVVCLMLLAFRVLRATGRERVIWSNCKDTFLAYVLVGVGFVFFQLLQVAYFAGKGALGDYLDMLNTATMYYSNYAIPFPGGISAISICGIMLLGVLVFCVLMRATMKSGRVSKVALALAGIVLSALLPLLFFIRLENMIRSHFIMWSVPLVFSILVSLYLACRDSLRSIGRENLIVSLSALLLSFYAALNLLDAYPKVDLGHFFMVMPPVLILFGYLGQRLYDCWSDYLKNGFSRAGRLVGGTVTGLIALGIFLPSLFMMLLFQVLIVPSVDGGLRLPEGKLSLVPRYSAGLERAEGIKVHALDDAYWPPLVLPETNDFFAAARRVSEITRADEEVFSTMSSGLMLFFLADRNSISDKANCYVFQTVTGVTTSDALTDFSDGELARLLEREKPGAIIVKKDDIETRRFMTNFPAAWSLITTNYHISEIIGPFQIYVPG